MASCSLYETCNVNYYSFCSPLACQDFFSLNKNHFLNHAFFDEMMNIFSIWKLLLQQPLEDHMTVCCLSGDLRFSINAWTVLYSDLHDFFLCCCCCCRYLLFRLWSDVLSLMTFIHTNCFFFLCPEIRSNVLFSPQSLEHELNVICWWTPFCPKWKGQRQFIIISFVMMRCVLIWWSIDVDILFDALNSWTDILETVDWTLNTEHSFLFL